MQVVETREATATECIIGWSSKSINAHVLTGVDALTKITEKIFIAHRF